MGDQGKKFEEKGGANNLEQQGYSNGVRNEAEEQDGVNKPNETKEQEISNGDTVKCVGTEEKNPTDARNNEQRAMRKESEEMPENQVERRNPLMEKLNTMNAKNKQAANKRRDRQAKAGEGAGRVETNKDLGQQNSEQTEKTLLENSPTMMKMKPKCYLPECGESPEQEKAPKGQEAIVEKELPASQIDEAIDTLKDEFSAQPTATIRKILEESGINLETAVAKLQQGTVVPMEQPNMQPLDERNNQPSVTPMEMDQNPMGMDQAGEETQQQHTEEKQVQTTKSKKRVNIKRPQERKSQGNDMRNETRISNETATPKKSKQSPPQKKSRSCKDVMFTKYQSLDEESDRIERRKMMEIVQENELEANYLFDNEIPKIIEEILTNNETKRWSHGTEMGKVWRALRVKTADNKHVLYLDSKLVIPETMRRSLQNTIHFGHTGVIGMLEKSKDLWWPEMYNWIFSTVQFCEECQKDKKLF